MFLWVDEVLEIDNHPGHKKGRSAAFVHVLRPIPSVYTNCTIQQMHNLYQQLLTVHGNELRQFGARAFPYSYYSCHASVITAVGIIVYIFSYATVQVRIELMTFPTLSDCAACYATDAGYNYYKDSFLVKGWITSINAKYISNLKQSGIK